MSVSNMQSRIDVIAAKEKRVATIEKEAKQVEAKAQAMLNDVFVVRKSMFLLVC